MSTRPGERPVSRPDPIGARRLTGDTLARQLLAVGAAADFDAMALPVTLGEEQARDVRRIVVALSAWEAGRFGVAIDDLADDLGLTDGERALIEQLRHARGRFSFYGTDAANWVFGRAIAAALDADGDFAIVAPAAAWAIHALTEVERVCRGRGMAPTAP